MVCIDFLDGSSIKKKETSTLLHGVLLEYSLAHHVLLFYQPIIRIDLITKGYIR